MESKSDNPDPMMERIAVAMLVQRMVRLSPAAFDDVTALLRLARAETNTNEEHEIYATIGEILFPEQLGPIVPMTSGK